MEKIITLGHKRNFIVFKNKIYSYEVYSGRIYEVFDSTKLLSDENYFNEIVNLLEFNRFEINYVYNYRGKSLFLPVSKELIEYYTTKDGHNNKIVLSNTHLNDNADLFYEFDLQVEIKGIEKIRFEKIGDCETEVCIPVPQNNEYLREKMTGMFGEPKIHPENEGDKYGRFDKEYFIPKSQIDKIIGVKKYRDKSTIGQLDGELFTGETEEIILDLHNFDESIYKVFKEHGVLEINEY